MTGTILKAGCAVLFLAVVFLSGVCWVNLRTIDDLTARNEELSASLKAVDLLAKEQDQTYKENLDEIQKNSKRDRDAAADHYRRLLSEAADRARAGTPTENPETVDTGPGKSAITGCDIETEKRCVADALTVKETSEFFKVNKFPVID